MKSKMTRRYEENRGALGEEPSTTAPATGNVRWQVIVGLLFMGLLGLVYSVNHYEGEVWEPPVRNDGYDIGLPQDEPEVEPVPVEETEPLDLSTEYRVSCQANTIIAGSYGACKNHASCQLSNEEMMAMYIAGKTAVIVCKKYEMLELYKGLNTELETLKQLEEAPLDDVFEEEKADAPSGNLRITS